jgi:hypothetical protein
MRLLNCWTPARTVSTQQRTHMRRLYSTFIRDTKECLRRSLLRLFIGVPNGVIGVPNGVIEGVLFPAHCPDLGRDPHFELRSPS